MVRSAFCWTPHVYFLPQNRVISSILLFKASVPNHAQTQCQMVQTKTNLGELILSLFSLGRALRERAEYLLMVQKCWVHDMEAGIRDLSKHTLFCLVRFVQPLTPSSQFVQPLIPSSHHWSKSEQPPGCFESKLLSHKENILPNFLWQKNCSVALL